MLGGSRNFSVRITGMLFAVRGVDLSSLRPRVGNSPETENSVV
jgi:hypothetical protein